METTGEGLLEKKKTLNNIAATKSQQVLFIAKSTTYIKLYAT